MGFLVVSLGGFFWCLFLDFWIFWGGLLGGLFWGFWGDFFSFPRLGAAVVATVSLDEYFERDITYLNVYHYEYSTAFLRVLPR